MTMNRERLYDKIRALLNKTTEHGCTEAEALAALTKARAMMDAYEVTADDLQLAKDMAAILKDCDTTDDKHGIARYLVKSVAMFCDCDGWRRGDKFVFCGSPADVALADWMHHHLIGFVQAELSNYLMRCDYPRGLRRRMINGFVIGCTGRILARVNELVERSKRVTRTEGNNRALVIIKQDAIRDLKIASGIMLKTRAMSRRMDEGARVAGVAAGDRATLHRPVDTKRGAMLLK